MEKPYRQLSIYLKKCRENSGISQGEIAKYLGYTTPQFISNWERGLSSPPMDKLADLIKLIKIKPEIVLELMSKDSIEILKHDFKRYKLIHSRKKAN